MQRQQLGTVRPLEVWQAQEIYMRSKLDQLRAVGEFNKQQFNLFVATGNDLQKAKTTTTKTETLFHRIAGGLPNAAKSKMFPFVRSFEIIRDGFYCELNSIPYSTALEGHLTLPYEQNTQQSPCRGFRRVLQFSHS
jgi:hypothetical protein